MRAQVQPWSKRVAGVTGHRTAVILTAIKFHIQREFVKEVLQYLQAAADSSRQQHQQTRASDLSWHIFNWEGLNRKKQKNTEEN